jgi:hypothetical protein
MKQVSSFNSLRRRILSALLSLALLAPTAISFTLVRAQQALAQKPVLALSSVETEASAQLRVETIREVTAALSSEEMQGRGTMQPGGDRAAQFIADRFSKLGLKPLGDKNTFLQAIKFRETQFLAETTFKVGEEAFKLGSDFAVSPPLSGDKSASGKLVFIAYGLISTVPKRNDLAGVNLQGKVVVMLEGPPQSVDKAAWKKADAQMNILLNLIRQGVAGIIFVNHGREKHPFSEMADYLSRRQLEPADNAELPPELPPFLMVSAPTAEKMFTGTEMTFAQALAKAETEDFKPVDLKKSAKIAVRLKKSKGVGSNVVGLLEGSDPKLKEEAVIYTAHYDAYGVGADNKSYPGAADNALGVGEMLAIAEAFTRAGARPRRSIIFLAVTGEEYGLHGSEYWVKHPTWKIKQIAANLNFDGIGTEVYGPVKSVVGFGAEHSDLGAVLGEVVSAAGVSIIPDPVPDENTFYRSDHYSFVKKGIPSLMLLGAPEGKVSVWVERMKKWEKTDYHQPTDVIRPDWNWDGARTIALIGLITGMRVANADAMPVWLKSSPFNRERGTNEAPPPMP